jgi:hypothetical protein
MNESEIPEYLDYVEQIDPNAKIAFDIPDTVIVNSRTSIKITFKAEKVYPTRTQFRFVIPYGFEPIKMENGFCLVKSDVKLQPNKTAISQIMLSYTTKEPLKVGGVIEFNYNEQKQRMAAGNVAYVDELETAFDIKLPSEKHFTRVGKKIIKMVSDEASFLLVKIPSVYLGEPVDIQIVALDKFGNRDTKFEGVIEIDGDNCLDFPNSVDMKKGYAKIEKALNFKSDYRKDSKLDKLLFVNRGYEHFPVFPELLSNIGRIYVETEEIKGKSNPIVWDEDISSQLYWGDTHIHTREFSDGIGTGRDGFHYAKNVVLHDFAALGDHLNQRFNVWMEGRKTVMFPYDRSVWNNLIELCKEFTDNIFVALPGYEWSGRELYVRIAGLDSPYEFISDKVILFPLDTALTAPLIDYASPDGCLQEQLYEFLKDVECAIMSHTPISWSMGTSWSELRNDFEKVVEIYSSHGSSEEFGGGYRPLITNRKEGSVHWALNHGIKLGFIGGGDDHYTHPGCPIRQYKMKDLAPSLRYKPGIAAIFSENLSSKNLISNLNNRNCYATTGERMWIKIKINSTLMGQETIVNEPPVIVVTVCGTEHVESVELIKNGEIITVRTPAFDRIKFAYIDDELKNGEEAYYYVRVTQFDGERGWSSPIWADAKY